VAKKEFIGLSYEYDRIRMARIQAKKNSIKLLEVDTIHLPHPIVQSSEPEFGSFDTDDDDLGNLFELDEGESSGEGTGGLDDFLSEPTSEKQPDDTGVSSLEDDFDMTRADDDDVEAENEKVLADYLSKLGRRKILLGTHIPFGKTTFQFFKNVDPDSMRKKDRIEFFEEKLGPIHSKDVNPEDYAWVKVGEKDCLVSYTPDERQLVNLVEVAETYFNGSLLINERLPDEAIWASLAATNYNLAEDDITGIIGIGETTSRVFFMKGNEIINILPIITEGESSEKVLNTIFSKILFEIDKGDLPKITRLLLARSTKLSEKAKSYLSKQFDDVEVDYLTLNPEKVSYSDEILNSALYHQPYLSAIGAAWAASKIDEKEFSKFSTLPEYIIEKQRVFKIEWHGIAILILIGLTPLYLNNLFHDKAAELQQIEQEVRSVETQIDELRPIATMTEDLINDLQLIQSENDRLLELAAYSQKWSQMNQILNSGVNEIPSIWLTSLRTVDENVSLTGISLTRSQIPELAWLFSDAHIQQVSETEIRDQPVYTFALQANNVRQDIEEFLLEMPEPDFDSEYDNEFEIDLTGDTTIEQESEPEIVVAEQQAAEPSAPSTPETSAEEEPEDEPSNEIADVTPENETVQASEEPEEIAAESGNSSEPDLPEEEAYDETEFSSPYGLLGQENELLYGAYTIVLYSLIDADSAEEMQQELLAEGFKTTLWPAEINEDQTHWRVGVGQFELLSDALSAMQTLPEPYRSNNFITRIR
jgi:hypothetical protein